MYFTKPDSNVAQLELRGSERVAVFGSGAGGHSLAAMKLLKGNGRVFAFDHRMPMVEKLKSDATRMGFSGLTVKNASFEVVGGTGMFNESFDVVIVPNTLYAAKNKKALVAEAFRILKVGGRLLIVDWSDSYGGMGPQPEYIVSPEAARGLAEQGGFHFTRSFTAGAQHYGLIFSKEPPVLRR